MPNLHIFQDTSELSRAAAEFVARTAAGAITARGRCTVAISGGSLPKLIAPLAAEPLRSQVDWATCHIAFADERCVPLDHPDSNYRLAAESLFHHLPIPPHQIYPINPALPPAEMAAAYEQDLRRLFAPQSGPWPRFDLILLGMGPDGHTASLFPGHPLLAEQRRWVAPIFDSPKPPPERITLTLPMLNAARQVTFIAGGAGKAPVLPHILADDSSLPAGRVRPAAGQLHWFVDDAAAAQLNRT